MGKKTGEKTMGEEIERKFLVKSDEWRCAARSQRILQGYLKRSKNCVIRARLAGEKGFLTIKGPASGYCRKEYEYEIPGADCAYLLENMADKPLIEKIRHYVPYDCVTWEIDEFLGENSGLIVAEIELCNMDQKFDKPAWLGCEVTGDKRYYNANLVENPYSRWK